MKDGQYPASTKKGPRTVELGPDHPLLAREHWPVAIREPRHTVVAFDPSRPSKNRALDPPIDEVRQWISSGRVTGRPAFDRHSILTNKGPAPDEPVGITVGGRLEEGSNRFLLDVQMRADHPEPHRVNRLEEDIRSGRVKYVSMTSSKNRGLLEVSFCADPLRAGCEIITASDDVATEGAEHNVCVYEVCLVAGGDDDTDVPESKESDPPAKAPASTPDTQATVGETPPSTDTKGEAKEETKSSSTEETRAAKTDAPQEAPIPPSGKKKEEDLKDTNQTPVVPNTTKPVDPPKEPEEAKQAKAQDVDTGKASEQSTKKKDDDTPKAPSTDPAKPAIDPKDAARAPANVPPAKPESKKAGEDTKPPANTQATKPESAKRAAEPSLAPPPPKAPRNATHTDARTAEVCGFHA